MLITKELLTLIGQHYRLDIHGVHGFSHWARVYEHGKTLSEQEGVNQRVVELFSLFHDSRRFSDGIDSEHGKRGALLAMELRDLLPLKDDEFELLLRACRLHTAAATDSDITVQCCFDADRLDLWRVGIRPVATRLCSPLAKRHQTILETQEMSEKRQMPEMPFGLSRSQVEDFLVQNKVGA